MLFVKLFVRLLARDVRVVHSNNETEYDLITDTIYYNPAQNPADYGFFRHLRECHFFDKPERFSAGVWSLAHEIGHYYNQDEEPDEEAKVLCAIASEECARSSVSLQNMYYNSPDEFSATEWACGWIAKHPIFARLFSMVI